MRVPFTGSSSLLLLSSGAVMAAGLLAAPQAPKPAPAVPAAIEAKFIKESLPLLKANCMGCHTGEQGAGGIRFDLAKTAGDLIKDPDLWDRVLVNLRNKTMPPAGSKPMAEGDRKKLIGGVHEVLLSESSKENPGRVTLRRLNRYEYSRTVRDLLHVDLNPAEDFPSDNVGEGFDNIGDVLTLSPLHLEGYLRAAEQLSAAAIVIPESKAAQFESPSFSLAGSARTGDDGIMFFSVGTATVNYEAKAAGPHRIIITAYGQQAGPEPCKMDLIIDNRIVTTFNVAAEQEKPATYEMPIDLAPGRKTIALRFPNDYYDEKFPNPRRRDRNLVVMSMRVESPATAGAVLPRSHRELIPRTPTPGQERPMAKDSLRRFMAKAYRRPVSEAEVDKLMKLWDVGFQRGRSMERAMRLAVQGVLTSPHFLFRVELDDRPQPGPAQELNAYQLASRLSYFIWASMPDDALSSKAADGSLLKPEVLKAEVARMLKDPKADALADSFAMQWLELERLTTRLPDPKLYPTWSEDLKKDMIQETRLFVMDIMRNNRSILDFIDGPYTYLNERLARHYGISGVRGTEFRRVSLEGTARGGILTQGSVLTATSNPTRTSPVKRGKWVLDAILGSPPPPPPPGADVIPPSVNANVTLTIREKIEMHREDPACANCHAKMDPLGFGLENFDGVGAWRDQENGQKVDTTGSLPGGVDFEGPVELKKILKGRGEEFSRTFSTRLLTYGLGRGLRNPDRRFIEEVSNAGMASGYTFSAYVQGVVLSDAFRRRTARDSRR